MLASQETIIPDGVSKGSYSEHAKLDSLTGSLAEGFLELYYNNGLTAWYNRQQAGWLAPGYSTDFPGIAQS